MNSLNNIFTFSNCLTQMQLTNYIQQKLDSNEVYAVESHLNECPFCSDALDGLMTTTDLTFVESICKEIKPILIHEIISNQPVGNSENNHISLKVSSNKNKWLVAASILFLLSLGGYSVYSFIHDRRTELAMKEENEKTLPIETKYSEKASPTSNEIVELSVPDKEIFVDDIKDEYLNDNIDKSSSKISTSDRKNKSKSSNIEIEPKIQAAQKVNEDVVMQSPPLIESQKYHDNYNQVENKKAEVALEKESISKQKISTVGLSKKFDLPQVQNNAANQLNYSSPENLEKEISTSDFEIGIEYFNKNDFKNAASFLEKARNIAEESIKIDIEYYLAQAYMKNGNISEAEKLFLKLKKSKKYNSIIEEKFLKTKK